eukprot:gene9222-biopygen6098
MPGGTGGSGVSQHTAEPPCARDVSPRASNELSHRRAVLPIAPAPQPTHRSATSVVLMLAAAEVMAWDTVSQV